MKFIESAHLIRDALVEMPEQDLLALLRSVRDLHLSETDWTQLPDSPLTDQKRSEWAIYRQQLRDIVETRAENILDTVFPTQPTME